MVLRMPTGDETSEGSAPGEVPCKHVPYLLQPRLPRTILGKQLPGYGHLRRGGPRIDPSLPGDPFVFPVAAVGSAALREESLTSYELGYTGVIEGRTIVSAAFYINEIDNIIQFTQTDTYDSTNPPLGWPLPPSVLDELDRMGLGLPAQLSFRNLERARDKGIELSVDTSINPFFNIFANYSWQDEPEPTSFDLSELNLPPTHRFNAGSSFVHGRFFGNASVSFAADAFWQDVLDARFHGPTDAYTLVNAGFGIQWEDGKVSTIIEINNLMNSEIQQHVFGDILTRLIVGKLRFRF